MLALFTNTANVVNTRAPHPPCCHVRSSSRQKLFVSGEIGLTSFSAGTLQHAAADPRKWYQIKRILKLIQCVSCHFACTLILMHTLLMNCISAMTSQSRKFRGFSLRRGLRVAIFLRRYVQPFMIFTLVPFEAAYIQ